MKFYFYFAFAGCFFIYGVVLATRLLLNLSSDGWDWNDKSRPAIFEGDNAENEEFWLAYRTAFILPVSFMVVSSVTLVFLLSHAD